MPAHAHEPWDVPNPQWLRNDPFSLQSYLDRQYESFGHGPTMAEILDDLDQYRHESGPTTTQLVDELHESRQEREESLEDVWRK